MTVEDDETALLLRSPRNAERLLRSIRSANSQTLVPHEARVVDREHEMDRKQAPFDRDEHQQAGPAAFDEADNRHDGPRERENR